ncbi:hypothetical protein HDE_04357 [Halotydeus destructor]|nr:hypothetical protein HDE_04357 [Halotydeus destructor]
MGDIAELEAALVASGINETVPKDLLAAYLVATDNDTSAAVGRITAYQAARQSLADIAPTFTAAQKLVNLGLVGTAINNAGKVVIWQMSGLADPSAISAQEYTQGMLAIAELKAVGSPKGHVFVTDWSNYKRPGFLDDLQPEMALRVAQYFATLPIKVEPSSSILVNTTPEVVAEFRKQGHVLAEHGVFVGTSPADILAAVGTTDSGQGQRAALLAELEANKAALEWRWTQLQK